MGTTKLQESLSAGQHKYLQSFIGHWQGQTKTWFQPGDPVDVSPMEGTIRQLFDGRFLLHEYQGSFNGQPFQGIAIYGYDLKTQKFQCAWVDSFHMGSGIMFSESKKAEDHFNVLGKYVASADDPQEWRWRTELTVIDESSIAITAFNISPDDVETKATETMYHRK